MPGRRTSGHRVVFLLVAISLVRSSVWSAPSAAQTPGAAPRTSARIHHFHFVVDDPIDAIQTRADTSGGIVVPLPGLGAGVRVGSLYLLFDSNGGSKMEPAAPDRMASMLRSSARWLSDRGVSVEAGEFTTLLSALVNESWPLDHVGFVSTSYENAVDDIEAHGERPMSRTRDAAIFALPDGTKVEIVRDTEAPDAYWCPMHPGVRSGATGTCPLCSMELVAIRPPRSGEYRMDVAVTPGARGRGLSGVRLVLRDPVNGQPVSDLLTVHEKLLHLFIVSRDLEYFAHVHPETSGDGRFVLKHETPPGEYVMIADFLPKNGTSQMVHRAIVAPGLPRPAVPTAIAPRGIDIPDQASSGSGNPTWGSAEKTVDGVRIRLDAADLIAGRIGLLRFHLFDAVGGTPITDLELYLGAPGHMLLTNATLTDAVHGHPEETGTRTPYITFKPMMPPSGAAKLWFQFQRQGKVTTVSFVIDILEP